MTRIARLTIGPALLLALVGCGSELSVEEFTTRANETCREADRRSVEAQPDDPRPRTFQEAAGQLEAVRDIAEDELEAISELNEPGELRDSVEAYLDARREAVDLLDEGVDAAEDGDFSSYQRAKRRLNKGQMRRRRLARQAQLSACSKPIPDYDD